MVFDFGAAAEPLRQLFVGPRFMTTKEFVESLTKDFADVDEKYPLDSGYKLGSIPIYAVDPATIPEGGVWGFTNANGNTTWYGDFPEEEGDDA